MMFGWFKNIWIFSSLMNCSVISYFINRLFSITFRAHMNPVYLSLTRDTLPYLPFPNSFILSKSWTLTFLRLFDKSKIDELLVDSVLSNMLVSDELYSSILLLFMGLISLTFLTKNAGTFDFFDCVFSLLNFFTFMKLCSVLLWLPLNSRLPLPVLYCYIKLF